MIYGTPYTFTAFVLAVALMFALKKIKNLKAENNQLFNDAIFWEYRFAKYHKKFKKLKKEQQNNKRQTLKP